MTAILIYIVLVASFLIAIKKPFAFVLIYVWLEYFRPQQVDPAVFSDSRVMLVFGVLAVGSLLFHRGRVDSIVLGVITWFLAILLWTEFTTSFAEVPDMAQLKMQAVLPLLLFSITSVLGIKDYKDLYFYIAAAIAGSLVHIFTAGIKAMLGSGGYGYTLGIANDNFGLAESSTLGVMAVVFVLLYQFAVKIAEGKGFLHPSAKFSALFYIIVAAAVIGSSSRAGLVSLVVLIAALVFHSPKIVIRRLPWIILLSVIVGYFSINEAWIDRMSTIQDYSSERSANNRLAIWSWTIDYVFAHPFGGGFFVNRISNFDWPGPDGQIFNLSGVGFHSIFFEVLGEHGFIGFVLYYGMVGRIFWKLVLFYRSDFEVGSLYLREAAFCLVSAWLVYLAGAAFVAVAFLPYTFLLVVLSATFLSLSKIELGGRR